MTTTPSRHAPPAAKEAVVEVAKQYGVCIRPISVKRIDIDTGQADIVDVPCGATLEAKCEPCARRAAQLRTAQCREGWHLDHEPTTATDPMTDHQGWLIEKRADAQALRDQAAALDELTEDLDALIDELDAEIADTGIRGNVLPDTQGAKRTRSTRRRQDAPDLPKRTMTDRTVGRTFTSPDGKTYRPSMFLTLTLPSYGRVRRDGTPADPTSYDYQRAARDALHFAKLIDRFVQNLRRVAGYEVQYFASVEPQRRHAPHLHMAIRGSMPRVDLKAVIAATYHQVWWPPTDHVRYEGEHLPVWDTDAGYLDPATGECLPTWQEALDVLDADELADPLHVVRFGQQADVQGVLAGTKDADQCIRYLSKYLTKSIADCHTPDGEAQRAHTARLLDALRYEPCSPTCANWLRYGIQPKNARAGLVPGACRGKAHKAEHLGYAGRRVLVSRKWSGKTLTEHARDRRAWVMEALGLSATDQHSGHDRYLWRPVAPGDPGVPSLAHRLLKAIAERQRWRNTLADAQTRPDEPPQDLSATDQQAA